MKALYEVVPQANSTRLLCKGKKHPKYSEITLIDCYDGIFMFGSTSLLDKSERVRRLTALPGLQRYTGLA